MLLIIKSGRISCTHSRFYSSLVRLVYFTGQIFDILRRPAFGLHTKMQTHRGQNFLDFVQGFPPEIRGAEHIAFGFLNQIADIEDVVVFQAVCRTDRQLQFIDLAQQVLVKGQFFFFFFSDTSSGSSKLMKTCNWSCMMRAA